MNMVEKARLVSGLQSVGWTEEQITNFFLYVSGDKPKESQDSKEKSE